VDRRHRGHEVFMKKACDQGYHRHKLGDLADGHRIDFSVRSAEVKGCQSFDKRSLNAVGVNMKYKTTSKGKT